MSSPPAVAGRGVRAADNRTALASSARGGYNRSMVTPDKARALMESSRPRPGLRGSWLLLLGCSTILGGLMADAHLLGLQSPWNWLVPQLLLLAIIAIILRGILRNRRTGRFMLQVFEAVQLRNWDEAEPILTQLLAAPIHHAQVRTELLSSLSAVAESQDQFDAAQCLYEGILQERRGDPLQLHTATVALAATLLRTGQLADAVNLIDRLARAELPNALKAQVEVVSLMREIVMGQTEDGLAEADRRRKLFRDHLGTRAGYGYGLLAAAFDRARQEEPARRYWHDATLLIRPADLLRRFRELEAVAGKYPSAEVAL